MINQCDGCRAGLPVTETGQHRMGGRGYPDYMSCQRQRYAGNTTSGVRRREHPDGNYRVLVNHGEIVSAMLFNRSGDYLAGWQAE